VMHVIQADQGLEIGNLPLGRELTRQERPTSRSGVRESSSTS
jgi:hypothetical protein